MEKKLIIDSNGRRVIFHDEEKEMSVRYESLDIVQDEFTRDFKVSMEFYADAIESK